MDRWCLDYSSNLLCHALWETMMSELYIIRSTNRSDVWFVRGVNIVGGVVVNSFC